MPNNLFLDGEIYYHGYPLETINHLAKKWRPGESETLKLYCYDAFLRDEEDTPWSERMAILEKGVKTIKSKHIVLVPTYSANSEKEGPQDIRCCY